jgi:DMSO/TMAO reductase YedYZ molybdopterin-dependent catalytic subunit
VRPAELLALVGAPAGTGARFTSLEPRGPYRLMTMEPEFVRDPRTLVALELNGEPLDVDHGYPARVIAPARPGVLQTKWLARLEST